MKKINLKKIGVMSVGTMLALLSVLSLGVGSTNAAITSNLSLGSKGVQVSELQQLLASNPLVYSQGIVSGYFGGLTVAAVQQFQLAYGISQTGTVGPITRAKINSIQASGLGLDLSAPMFMSAPVVQVTGTGATVSWNTNESARGKLIYSTTPIVTGNSFEATGIGFLEPSVVNGLVAPYDAIPRLSQNISVANLAPSTTYYYMVMSLDASNNVSVTPPASFRTN